MFKKWYYKRIFVITFVNNRSWDTELSKSLTKFPMRLERAKLEHELALSTAEKKERTPCDHHQGKGDRCCQTVLDMFYYVLLWP